MQELNNNTDADDLAKKENGGFSKEPEPEGSSGASARKLAANRRNALRSTGPKTLAGKARVRLNAVKHGLLSKQLILFSCSEDSKEFEKLLVGLWRYFQPIGDLESLDVQQIAVCFWRDRRALRWEIRQQQQAAHFVSMSREEASKSLHEKLGLEYSKEVGTEEDEASSRDLTRRDVLLGEVMPKADALDSLIRYQAANDRRLHRLLVHLERLQRERKGEFVPAPVSVSLQGIS